MASVAALAATIGLMVPPPGAGASPRNATLWVQRYNGPANGSDEAESVAVSPDGSRVFVTGQSFASGRTAYDYATIAYDAATGQVLWGRGYNGSANSNDVAYSVAVSPDGSKVFVTGSSFGRGTFRDYATIAYDAATGQVLWVERYNGPANSFDIAQSVAVSPDGSEVFVTGQSDRSGGSDYATIAYDAATGQGLWIKRYNGSGNGTDVAYALVVSPDGSTVFVTGESTGSGTAYDYATIAYEATTGRMLWVERYNGRRNDDDAASSVTISPDGSRVLVTGSSIGSGAGYDYATISYDAATGKELWAERYNGPANDWDLAYSVAVSPDGSRAFVTGYSVGPGTWTDYATISYDAATGQELWGKRYNGSANSNDIPYSVAVSPDGMNVLVTGFSSVAGRDDDYATIAYGASSGEVFWGRRYNGPANSFDIAKSLVVSPDGSRVFVTGQSEGSGTALDYATIAYSTS